MAFSDNKITVADLTGKGVTGMADTPNLSTAQMQQKLDEIAKEVIPPKFNALCDDLDATDFASIITSKSTDKMLFQRLNEYDQMEYSVDNVNWSLIASGKEVLDPTLEADVAKNALKLGGQLPTYYQKATDDTLNTTDKTTTGAINEINTALGNVDTTANEAPTYNATLTYAVGDYVSYEKHIYKCNTAIETAEAWNATHWTQTTLGEEIETVNNRLGDLTTYLNEIHPSLKSLLDYWIENGDLSNPNYVALIAIMTSDNTPSGYVASASSFYETNPAYKAFNGTNLTGDSDCWMPSSVSGTVYIQMQIPTAKTAKKLTIANRTNSTVFGIKNFKLQGANDGSTFTDIATLLNPSNAIGNETTFKITNETAYKYYRLLLIDGYEASYYALAKFQLYGI